MGDFNYYITTHWLFAAHQGVSQLMPIKIKRAHLLLNHTLYRSQTFFFNEVDAQSDGRQADLII